MTVYRGATRTLLALGNWGRTDQTVSLDLDVRALGLSRLPVEFKVPAIAQYQPGSILGSLQGVIVPGGEGRLIVFDNH